jgi:Protein of unknown function (DUF541)
MHVSRRSPTRFVLAIAIAAAVLVIGAATAFGQGTPRSDQPISSGGVSGMPGTTVDSAPDGVVSSGIGIAAPAWCCGTSGAVPGLTTVGQATIDGQDPAARDAAIAAAVKDATAQATAAADAAGIHLGSIIDMQVSAMPYYAYPMMGAGSGTSPGSPGGGGGMEPAPAPDVFQGSVSVTVTWALS